MIVSAADVDPLSDFDFEPDFDDAEEYERVGVQLVAGKPSH